MLNVFQKGFNNSSIKVGGLPKLTANSRFEKTTHFPQRLTDLKASFCCLGYQQHFLCFALQALMIFFSPTHMLSKLAKLLNKALFNNLLR